MLTLFGWGVLTFLVAKISIGAFLVALNNLGEYNIGGVPNSTSTKLKTWVLIALVIVGWYFVFTNIPFNVVLTKS